MAAMPISTFMRYVLMTGTAVWANWDTISQQFDRHTENATAPTFGYFQQNIFEFKDGSGTFTPRERGMFGIHWLNTTGGDLDTTWTTADYVAAEAAVQAFWNAIAGFISNQCRLVEHRWYAFGPGVASPNPPSRVQTIGTPLLGSGTQAAVRQVAQTITLRTPLRRHWGRIYVPVASAYFDSNGQMTQANTDTLANAARTMFTAPGTSQGLVPVVYDRSRRAALTVTQIEVDSVPDIIRRRRPRSTTYKKLISA